MTQWGFIESLWRAILKNKRFFKYIGVFFVAFIASFLSSKLEAPISSINAFSEKDYSVSLSVRGGALYKDFEATPGGTMVVLKHYISMSTNAPHGASVMLSSKYDGLMRSNSPNPSSNYQPQDRFIKMTQSTSREPSPLGLNEYGFAIAAHTSPASVKFSQYDDYESQSQEVLFNARFANHSSAIVYSGRNNSFNVYYGANVSSDGADEGSCYYIDEVSYTAYVLSSEMPRANLKIFPSSTQEADNKTNIKIRTGLRTDKQFPNEYYSVLINGVECSDLVVTKDYPNRMEFSCQAPARETVGGIGSKNVTIKLKGIDVISVDNAFAYVDPTPMQTFSAVDCAAMQEHDIKYLKDNRDNEIYSVAKLKDGRCWMTQNLRLKLDENIALTSLDSDVDGSWTSPRSTESTLSNWESDPEQYKTVRSYQNSADPEAGTFYTFAAATSQAMQDIEELGAQTGHSICPSGWQLPNSSNDFSNNDFYNMAKFYIGGASIQPDNGNISGGHDLIYGPPNLGIDGYISGGQHRGKGDYSYYWSGNLFNKFLSYNASTALTSFGSANSSGRYNGYPIRCVLRQPEYLQDFTPNKCYRLGYGRSTILADKRDGQSYTVSRLEDGRCWMTQDLRLSLQSGKALTPDSTDINTDWIPAFSTQELGSTNSNPPSASAQSPLSYVDKEKDRQYGKYYSYSAATATSGDQLSSSGQDAQSSICPKGWRLPKSQDSLKNDANKLIGRYTVKSVSSDYEYQNNNSAKLQKLNFLLSGKIDYSSNSVSDFGVNGFWWLSTARGNQSAATLEFSNDAIYPFSQRNRSVAAKVRCVFRGSDPTPIQDFTHQDCHNLQEHEFKFLQDSRDEEIYAVTKMKDGRCWMAENLRLKLSNVETLTPDNSDVNQPWTPLNSTEQSDQDGRGTNWGRLPNNAGYKQPLSIFSFDGYTEDGVYYNFPAANANNDNISGPNGQERYGSVCPKNWRLPSAGNNIHITTDDHEFYNMAKMYTHKPWQGDKRKYYTGEHALHGVFNIASSGQYSGGQMYKGTEYKHRRTYLWTGTMYGSQSAAYISFDPDDIHIENNINFGVGNSVRCINKLPEDTIETNINYMQDMTPSECGKLRLYQKIELIDRRDNERYNIVKLRDGKCWMAQNLRLKLDISKALTPDTTDVETSWVPSHSTDSIEDRYQAGTAWPADNFNDARSIYILPELSNYGVYYNHNAATAGSNTITYVKGYNQPMRYYKAPFSICPKGWRLPNTGSDQHVPNNSKDGDIYELGQAELNTNIGLKSKLHPFGVVFSGGYYYANGNSFENMGSYAFYITSTYSRYNYGRSIDYYSTLIYSGMSYYPGPDIGGSRNSHENYRRSFPIRCVAR